MRKRRLGRIFSLSISVLFTAEQCADVMGTLLLIVRYSLLLAIPVNVAAQLRAKQYHVPPAKLEAIHPKGLRVSIPGKILILRLR